MLQTNGQGAKVASDDFGSQAQSGQHGFLREFLYFLTHNKRWWLAPILIVLFLVGMLLILGSTGMAPLIYTLF